jgi:hypothetical protein
MYSTDSTNDGRRAIRHLIAVACAVVVVASLAACGGSNEEPTSSYQAICEVQQECLDDQFDRTHGTVGGCAAKLKANAEISTKSGECLQKTEAVFECRAENARCQNNQVSYGSGCSAEVSAQTTACRGAIAGQDDFRSLCENIKSCVGESEFNSTYGDMEMCIDNWNSQIQNISGSNCKELASDFMYCLDDTLQCDQGSASTDCQDETDTFEMQCDSP